MLKKEWRKQSSPTLHMVFCTYRATWAIGRLPLEDDIVVQSAAVRRWAPSCPMAMPGRSETRRLYSLVEEGEILTARKLMQNHRVLAEMKSFQAKIKTRIAACGGHGAATNLDPLVEWPRRSRSGAVRRLPAVPGHEIGVRVRGREGLDLDVGVGLLADVERAR